MANFQTASQEAVDALITQVNSAGIEVVRVCFVDQHGILRGKTIMAEDLAAAFTSGITMTSTLLLKDTAHITVYPVWQDDIGFGPGVLTGASDVVMVPVPETFRRLPWSPTNGLILSDLYFPNGDKVPVSSRAILGDAIARLHDRGFELMTGLEVEFHVFREVDPKLSLEDAGQPGSPPELELLSHGYQYLTEDRYDEVETVFDAIRRNAVEMGLPIRSMEIEFGPSQVEVTFHPATAAEHADNMIYFRSLVKQVCRRQGLHATFMCRPKFPTAMASGWHLHQSLVNRDNDDNLFMPKEGETISSLGRSWIAGLLEHATASCLFSTPTVNGYKRYRPFALAPDRIQWGRDNKGAMVRVLSAPGDPASRVENRIGDPTANPYFYMASQILCGLDGIDRYLDPGEPVERPYETAAKSLPASLRQAIEALDQSQFYRARLGDGFVDYMVRLKSSEWARYASTVSEWEEREYLSIY